ncbi:MAG: hypothetical protein HETSPECPRED_006653 [Heterodermia speciosa]|uniref:ABM domain-containing protein n=1 Tax=Heterodermia speciosa TaxID=116794 RepID=A0A8H3ITX5_9LECA|nr:MAG: hypothetical protein HETSPECPRED_006653 [Heterodermia speciosa]
MSPQLQSSHPFHGISLHVTIVVAPENADKFLESLRPCFDAVTAEPECMSFQVFHDAEQPGYFRFVENWSKDKDWLIKNQLTKDYYKPYEEATKPLWIKPRELKVFEQLDDAWTVVNAGSKDGTPA